MTTTEIKIPDDAWMDWPTEPGFWFCGMPTHPTSTIVKIEHTIERTKGSIYLYDADMWITHYDGYRFARVILPVVPSKENQ